MPSISRKKQYMYFHLQFKPPVISFFDATCMCTPDDKRREFLSDSDLVALSEDDEVSDTVNRQHGWIDPVQLALSAPQHNKLT